MNMPGARPKQVGRSCIMQVGVGAFVLNEHEEVLVVQEAHGPLRGKVSSACMSRYGHLSAALPVQVGSLGTLEGHFECNQSWST